MTDKMPAEIWANPPDEYGIGLYGPKKEIELGDERYIHEFHYKQLYEAYKKNRELMRGAPHSRGCSEGWATDCDCWKSEIEEVEGV